jgi:hypothetical protein
MALPKKGPVKQTIPLTYSKTLLPRREEIRDMITKDGTYLPKSLLHADLDQGFLDFVKEKIQFSVEGKKIPIIDTLLTTQNWSQFVQTWDFQNIDKNAEPPFIAIVRNPDVKLNEKRKYNIPNNRMYYYMEVPTWDGNQKGVDIYKIPQPIPVDIKYSVVLICNRMREANKMNQTIMSLFASYEAYQVINGHYIPIVNDSFTDESVLDLESRKYYVHKYEFTLNGFLMDSEKFKSYPALNRVLQLYEVDTRNPKNPQKKQQPPELQTISFTYNLSGTSKEKSFFYNCDLTLEKTTNINSFSVYINDQYFGDDINLIQINNGDVLRIEIIVGLTNETPEIVFTQKLV